MKLTPTGFTVEGVPFRVQFRVESEEVLASLLVDRSDLQLLGSVLTMAWKLVPIDLLESLLDRRRLNRTELFLISYNDDPHDEEEEVGVNLYEDDEHLVVTPEFFHQVVIELARAHVDLVGSDYFPWYSDLSDEARALVEDVGP